MEIYQLLYVAALGCAILELLTSTFILLGISFGIFSTAITQQLVGAVNLSRDVLIFSATTIVAIYVLRKLFTGKKDVGFNSDDDINQY